MHRNHFFSRLYVRTILCAVLCGAVIFCFTGCGGGSGDDSASVQTTAEERGKGAEMDPEKKAQLQKDQENGLFLLVNKDPENHLDPSYKAEDLEPIKYYAADRNNPRLPDIWEAIFQFDAFHPIQVAPDTPESDDTGSRWLRYS